MDGIVVSKMSLNFLHTLCIYKTCIYLYMYIYIYIHMCIYIYAYACTLTFTFTFKFTFTYTYIHTYIYIYIHTHTHTLEYTYTYIYMDPNRAFETCFREVLSCFSVHARSHLTLFGFSKRFRAFSSPWKPQKAPRPPRLQRPQRKYMYRYDVGRKLQKPGRDLWNTFCFIVWNEGCETRRISYYGPNIKTHVWNGYETGMKRVWNKYERDMWWNDIKAAKCFIGMKRGAFHRVWNVVF